MMKPVVAQLLMRSPELLLKMVSCYLWIFLDGHNVVKFSVEKAGEEPSGEQQAKDICEPSRDEQQSEEFDVTDANPPAIDEEVALLEIIVRLCILNTV